MQPSKIFETVLYAEDLAAAERFYHEALGLEVLERSNLTVVFRCGGGVLLIFDPRRVPHRIETFLPTGLQRSGTLLSLQSWRTSMRGGSNCVRLESPSNVRLIWMKAGIRSIFVTRQAMLLS